MVIPLFDLIGGGTHGLVLDDDQDMIALRRSDEENRLTNLLRYYFPILFVVSVVSHLCLTYMTNPVVDCLPFLDPKNGRAISIQLGTPHTQCGSSVERDCGGGAALRSNPESLLRQTIKRDWASLQAIRWYLQSVWA